MKEIWKDVVWYEWLYQVSDLGKVKSLNYNKTKREKILNGSTTRDWYLRVCLTKNLIEKTHAIHRLVLSSFILNINNKPQINHKNGIKSDNRVENLEWCTAGENIRYSYSNLNRKSVNRGKIWINNHCSKRIKQFNKDGNFIKLWYWTGEIKRCLRFDRSAITACCNNKKHRKSAYWFIRKYDK